MVRAEREAVVENPNIKDLPFSSEAKQAVFVMAPVWRNELWNWHAISPAHLVASLSCTEGTEGIFRKYKINRAQLINMIMHVDTYIPPVRDGEPTIIDKREIFFAKDTKEILYEAAELAKEDESREIKPQHILIAFTQIQPWFDKFKLVDLLGISIMDLEASARKSLVQEKTLQALREWKLAMMEGGRSEPYTVGQENDLADYGAELLLFFKDPDFVRAVKIHLGGIIPRDLI